MTGLYDRLSDKLDSEDAPSGITTMDIMELPGPQRAIMLALLRDPRGSEGIAYEELAQRFEQKIPELWETLLELKQRRWLIEMGEYPALSFRINLRAKRGIEGAGLWTALSDRLL
ncbi:MAG TPA: hypothetical protein VER79_11200 [Candidatus Limnocylindrales bacterium]|nr:hypothetical protein [Candidatus Limnocylindrales bacterium]